LAAFVDELVDAGATRVWLYGSFAEGSYGPESDIDLAVSFEEGDDEAFDRLLDLRVQRHHVRFRGTVRHLHLWFEPGLRAADVPEPKQLLHGSSTDDVDEE